MGGSDRLALALLHDGLTGLGQRAHEEVAEQSLRSLLFGIRLLRDDRLSLFTRRVHRLEEVEGWAEKRTKEPAGSRSDPHVKKQ